MARKNPGQREIIAHIDSAHTPGALSALMAIAKQDIQGVQLELELNLGPSPAGTIDLPAASSAVFRCSWSRIPLQAVEGTHKQLEIDAIADPVLRDLVVTRLVEPTCKRDSIRVLHQVNRAPEHVNTLHTCLWHVVPRDYRTVDGTACLRHLNQGTSLRLGEVIAGTGMVPWI